MAGPGGDGTGPDTAAEDQAWANAGRLSPRGHYDGNALTGTIVHVWDSNPSVPCHPALILEWGPVVSAVRVFGRSQREPDEWGDVREYPQRIPTPPLADGTPQPERVLLWWHYRAECDRVRR